MQISRWAPTRSARLMTDRTHFDRDRIHGSEGTLNDAQSLVGRYGFSGIENRFRQAGADDMEAVESGIGRNVGVITAPGEAVIGDLENDVLLHLVFVDDRGDAGTDPVLAPEAVSGA